MTEPREYDEKNIVIDDIECIRHTERAVLVVVNGEEHWIPASHVDVDSEVFQRGHRGKLIISKWIAGKRGLWKETDDEQEAST